MKKYIFTALFLTALPFHTANAACTITPEGIGGVKLGQTLAQVKRAFPHMKVRSESDATRAGRNPLVVRAVAVDAGANPVLSADDARRVLIENGASGFLDATNVVFIR